MFVLGISAFFHDSAAALVRDGAIVFAAQEERFTRKKHDPAFPRHAIQACLAHAGITLADCASVVFYDKPFLKFERLLESYLAFAPRGLPSFLLSMPVWMREKLFLKSLLKSELKACSNGNAPANLDERLLFTEHHLSHAASAFYPSPFSDAAILVVDGVGEWASTSLAVGHDREVRILKELHFPHSLGLLYSAFTYYTGFKVNSGEYKVMGLAPYGTPRYADLIFRELMDLKEDGTFRLNLRYLDYCVGLRMTNGEFDRLFEGPARKPDQLLTQKHMDLAASIQKVTEEVMLRLARSVARETGQRNLCLAGGVALNCVANGKILADRCFDSLWIQPAAGDAGGALGAALAGYYMRHRGEASVEPKLGGDAMKGAYLGPAFSQQEIERSLTGAGARFTVLCEDELTERAAVALEAGDALGWFQGRMEFGPRALGSRSILGDARSPKMQSILNLKVKYRESFRPFAPAVLREDVAEWFAMDADSPYMLLVADVVKERRRAMTAQEEALFGIDKLNVPRSEIPAVTHVDYSARIQTVHRETNPRLYQMLTRFKARTGCPVIVNTSFNVRGEPIVCTPEEAFRCFMGTELDGLAVGNCFLEKKEQDAALAKTYKDAFELD